MRLRGIVMLSIIKHFLNPYDNIRLINDGMITFLMSRQQKTRSSYMSLFVFVFPTINFSSRFAKLLLFGITIIFFNLVV